MNFLNDNIFELVKYGVNTFFGFPIWEIVTIVFSACYGLIRYLINKPVFIWLVNTSLFYPKLVKVRDYLNKHLKERK
ncbi:hypothetical protein GCM10008022_03790 [Paenibacillus hunanensis]|uniref:Uncharacterized protein n=1 Tax=Paenibacillus hunanensis TaxID=539262 RepID=A0ABU1IWC2_9BACL|nr:hypothetical protein [Paenibacillus hunanensis]GGI98314.1 hypothetical protein GCM10008022_03790 [Paenibacillus hunanensis]